MLCSDANKTLLRITTPVAVFMCLTITRHSLRRNVEELDPPLFGRGVGGEIVCLFGRDLGLCCTWLKQYLLCEHVCFRNSLFHTCLKYSKVMFGYLRDDFQTLHHTTAERTTSHHTTQYKPYDVFCTISRGWKWLVRIGPTPGGISNTS
jgi:hypothetical protein